MNKLIIGWLMAGLLFLLSCAHRSPRGSEPTPSKAILIGSLTPDQLLKRFHTYQVGKDGYQPDDDSLKKLRAMTTDIQILVFLGTWCSDSEREVPRFLKIMELIQNSHLTFELLGLDRSKRDAEGLAEKFQIEAVPTFIVLKNDTEIGRIVEAPAVGLEQDLVEILASVVQ